MQRSYCVKVGAIALGLCLMGVESAFALDHVFDLSEALSIARSSNAELKKAELQCDSAGWGKLEALSEHLPHLEARGTHYLDAKYPKLGVLFGGNAVQFPSAYPQTSLDLEASLLVFDGFGAINRYRASLFEAEASEFEFNHLRFKLERIIRVKFYQALAAQQLERVADQNIETLEQHLRLAQASVRAGFSTNVDVLRIESQLEEARAEKLLAVDNVEIVRQSLFESMGIEQDSRPLAGILPNPEAQKLPEGLTLESMRRDDLQALSRRELEKVRLSTASASVWFPRVTIFGDQLLYKYGNFDPAILPNHNFQNAYSVGVRLSWSIFDGGASIARHARASNAAAIAAENTRQALITSPHEFDMWKRKYVYNVALYQARKRSVEKSTESVRLATLGVKAGTKTNAETLDAELELFRARAGLIRAQVDAIEAWARLELAVGRELR